MWQGRVKDGRKEQAAEGCQREARSLGQQESSEIAGSMEAGHLGRPGKGLQGMVQGWCQQLGAGHAAEGTTTRPAEQAMDCCSGLRGWGGHWSG